ncbi:MAG: hypothetical protein CMD83_18120 [Gammaproteobacteria bacterium]|nr:hypothetical protein [Gammaproteobacteria bacterium]
MIHTTKLKIEERRTIKDRTTTELNVEELVEKYKDTDYDIVVTYGGPFDLLSWMKLRELGKTEIN